MGVVPDFVRERRRVASLGIRTIGYCRVGRIQVKVHRGNVYYHCASESIPYIEGPTSEGRPEPCAHFCPEIGAR